MREQTTQNGIRIALSEHGITNFRVNVGTGWQGEHVVKGPRTIGLGPRDVAVMDARPFSTGLPPGFSDLLGIVPVTITAEMIGMLFARVAFLEVKSAIGRLRPDQANFLKVMAEYGALTGVPRTPEEAIKIVTGVR